MTYDAMNKWVGGSVGGQTVGFSYDGMGRRVSRSVNGGQSDFWYDRTGLTHETGVNAATYLRSMQGSLLSQQTASGTYLYGKDRLGSVTALVTPGGTLANSYTYTPYGYLARQTGTASTPWTFTGAYRDNGAYYQMGARSYQQGTGRFTQQDPLPSSIFTYNRYSYTGGDPANRIDPTGLAYCDVNVTITHPIYLVGVTFGGARDIATGDIHGYGGAAVGTSGASLTCSPFDISTGLTVGLSGFAPPGIPPIPPFSGGQIGWNFAGGGGFWEAGWGVPGVAGALYWVF